MNQVFGCPSCQQPFQVAAEQAGQVVQCPSCARMVEIPIDAFPALKATDSPPAPSPPQIFACPSCQGQFGISPEMYGQQVGCPHCQTAVLIEDPGSSRASRLETPKIEASQIEAPQIEAPRIQTRKPQPGKRPKPDSKKSSSSKRWKEKSKPAKESADLVAPGFDSKTTKENRSSAKDKSSPQQNTEKAEPKIKPVRRSSKLTKTDKRPGKLDATLPSRSKSSSPSTSDLVPPGEKTTKAKKEKKRFQDPPSKKVMPNASVVPEEIVAEVVESSEGPVQAYVADQAVVVQQTSAPPNELSPDSESANNKGVPSAEDDADQALPPDPNEPDPIDHLLPPLFDVFDPTRIRGKSGEQYKVMLPDGLGGTTQVDRRVVRVQHEGEEVSLVVLTPKEKRRRRMIQNIIAIIIGIVVLTVAFFLLR